MWNVACGSKHHHSNINAVTILYGNSAAVVIMRGFSVLFLLFVFLVVCIWYGAPRVSTSIEILLLFHIKEDKDDDVKAKGLVFRNCHEGGWAGIVCHQESFLLEFNGKNHRAGSLKSLTHDTLSSYYLTLKTVLWINNRKKMRKLKKQTFCCIILEDGGRWQ